MNDLQLYEYYKNIPLAGIGVFSWIYPNYVKITGRSITRPHPHRHYTLDEFLDRLYDEGSDFREKLESGKGEIYAAPTMTIDKDKMAGMLKKYFDKPLINTFDSENEG